MHLFEHHISVDYFNTLTETVFTPLPWGRKRFIHVCELVNLFGIGFVNLG